MKGASRIELLTWINELLEVDVKKIDDVCSGYIFSCIFNDIYGDFPMSKIKKNTIKEPDWVHNYKLLQMFFIKHNIDKPIPVERLIKKKPQDCIEFLQWAKSYWDTNVGFYSEDGDSNTLNREAKEEAEAIDTGDNNDLKGESTSGNKTSTKSHASTSASSNLPSNASSHTNTANTVSKTTSNNRKDGPVRVLVDKKKEEMQAEQLIKMKITLDNVEKDRDYYFNKLREIEVLTMDESDSNDCKCLMSKIKEIMYGDGNK
eukprot:GHVP01009223.1.p1 GENE.GHVP01009223.1~~GHVP01009223.1.p1  ORF type:complete len:300 (-),score=37.31 GHVP01009223.1:23-802(-)